ncbi:alpha/beta hydrolase [Sphingomonas bacterium]|uniref:alpha/beta hydrolase n=1 Tax=Sphingomonas bacterium TaxID=1895847 RepID=UPI0015766BCF|nr:alpha/beta hydrolase [Sphingomonas bacterium]
MTQPSVTIASRDIPYPASISEEAREKLAMMAAIPADAIERPQDTAGWDAMIGYVDEILFATIAPPAAGTTVTPLEIGGVAAFDVKPQGSSGEADGRICLFLHGGGFTMGGGKACGAMATAFAEGTDLHTIGLDYRMPPHFPYPAPLDDCVAAYWALLETRRPEDIVVAGTSAGGNLAPALVLRARDEGLPLPSAVVLLSPEIDLTESGDSFETLMGVDPVLKARPTDSIELYAAGHDLSDPYLSPLFGDFAKGFPTTFLQCGTRDLFLSNTVRFHRALRKQDIPAFLHVFEAMPHGGFGAMFEGGLGASPEDRDVYEEVRRFLAALPRA